MNGDFYSSFDDYRRNVQDRSYKRLRYNSEISSWDQYNNEYDYLRGISQEELDRANRAISEMTINILDSLDGFQEFITYYKPQLDIYGHYYSTSFGSSPIHILRDNETDKTLYFEYEFTNHCLTVSNGTIYSEIKENIHGYPITSAEEIKKCLEKIILEWILIRDTRESLKSI